MALVCHCLQSSLRAGSGVGGPPRPRKDLCLLVLMSSTKSLSPETSGEDEDPDVASKLGMCNREIVRRGALILFCDYVVSVQMPCANAGGGGVRGSCG